MRTQRLDEEEGFCDADTMNELTVSVGSPPEGYSLNSAWDRFVKPFGEKLRMEVGRSTAVKHSQDGVDMLAGGTIALSHTGLDKMQALREGETCQGKLAC